MSLRATMEVARWEFLRYVKLRQQLVGLALTFVMGLVAYGVVELASGSDEAREVVVIGDALQLQSTDDFTFTPSEAAATDSLRAAVAAGDLAALVVVESADRAQLVMRRPAEWRSGIERALAAARQETMLERSGLRPDALAALLAPPQIEVSYDTGADDDERGARFAFIIMLVLMIMAVFLGMSYIFASITGEKQIRVTEQVVSAISAQSWIDGKIIGIIGVSLVSVANTAVAVVALLLVFGAGGFSVPSMLGDPVLVLVIIVMTLLGLIFWFAFLGAIAAMIDDPHNSTRGSLILVPVLATGLAFLVRGDPAGGFARTLSLLPPTAPSAMPARLLAGGDVGPVELLLSIVLLAAGTWLLRRVAGRIFRLAMLMYGKEPTWSEVRRWAMSD